ncbi:hypothetical protein ACFPM3_09275 [Streptomyces coeruleoprunus]|uniref:Secreted protein n=1 Tax=Streptomyces coeruleoprunus TaxID=285563 RepID=A0ABV9XAI1_9ACTN
MQTSAVPDLAHTHAGPMHWLVTATAMAGVVALAGLVQPEPATASLPGTGTAAAPAPAPAPDAAAVTYPLDCRGAPTVVARKATGDLDGDGRPETVAAVHCGAGSGTPPHGLYVLTGPAGAGPRVVATLVTPTDRVNIGDLAVRGGAVTATLLGYSSADVPRCCPDKREEVSWRWTGGRFVRGAGSEASRA